MNYKFHEKSTYIRYRMKAKAQGLLQRLFKAKSNNQKINHKSQLTDDEATAYIKASLESSAPMMVCRFGSVEVGAVDAYLAKRFRLTKGYSESVRRSLYQNAGFFSNDDASIDRFAEEMLAATGKIDLIGVWNLCEPYILKHYASRDTNYCRLGILTPKSALPKQWTSALAGKKVLVIHPFEATIRKQYANRKNVFPNGFLPDFDLKTIKAVQTIAGEKDNRFHNWFEALDSMKKQMDTMDYDVAIIGCGAYGFLLAAHAKEMGKQAIHLGGATQTLFGIMGKRWENNSKYAVNEYWVHPSEEETPEGAKKVEGGCYW